MATHVFTDTVNPSAAPPRAGAHWVNTVTGDQFFSKGTSSVEDWVLGGSGGGGGSGDGRNAEAQQVLHFLNGAGEGRTMFSKDAGRTFAISPVHESDGIGGPSIVDPALIVSGGAPTKLFAIFGAGEDPPFNIRLHVSIDRGLTWEDLGGGLLGWEPFGEVYYMVAGNDADNRYMIMCAGEVSANDCIFFYNGTTWSRVTVTSGLTYTNIFDLQGGLNNSFYIVEQSAGYNIKTSADGGVTWTGFVLNFNAGDPITCMAIDPTAGMLFSNGDAVYFSPDGTTAPVMVTGSDIMGTHTIYAIFAGNGVFSVWANDSTSVRVFTTDGVTYFREGVVLAFEAQFSSPSSVRNTVGQQNGIRAWWDGQTFIALIAAWTATSTESVPMYLRSEDGAVWIEASYAIDPNVVGITVHNRLAVIAQ